MKIELAKTEIIHFVGIGGIGMSGLALIMRNMGFKIQGSDASNSKNIERLKKNKIKVVFGHQKKILKQLRFWLFLLQLKKVIQKYWKQKKSNFQFIKEVKCLHI